MKKYNIPRSSKRKRKKIKGRWVNCENCEKRIWRKQCELNLYNHFFCSHKCYNIINKTKLKTTLICKTCEKKFVVRPSAKNRRYCSHKCYWKSGIHKGEKRPWNRNPDKIEKQSKKVMGSNNPNWKGGLSFEPYSSKFNEELKEKIRERDNYECQYCHKKFKGKKLQIHHIDYNKKNSSEFNLISLCAYHHGRTNSNREFWKRYFVMYQFIRSLFNPQKIVEKNLK